MILRGQIYWVNLNPTIGSEIKKTRPALIVSNDLNNRHSNIVTVLPITSNFEKIYPWEVFIPAGAGGLKNQGKIQANQIRTVDKRRLSGEPLGGLVPNTLLNEAIQSLKIHLEID